MILSDHQISQLFDSFDGLCSSLLQVGGEDENRKDQPQHPCLAGHQLLSEGLGLNQ